jgi:hypothetical protein
MNGQRQHLQPIQSPQAEVKFFGIPLGDFGFFTSVLMALTIGFLSFFLFTFLAIVGIMIYNGMGHQVNYAASYKYISFPAGCVVLAASLIFFGSLWLRRKLSGG